MELPRFAAEASLYTTARHYRSAVAGLAARGGAILPQSLFCARKGQACGGIDLNCCPGLRCTAAGPGELGVCVPDRFHCSPCVGGRQFCCPPPGFGLRCFVRPCQ
jgi:hypothetical protein